MRFATMNRNGHQQQALTTQQQKIFEMNNHPHAVQGISGMGQQPAMAMSYQKQMGVTSGQGGNRGVLANVLPPSH